ncbi:DUF3237 domain-containing protein [Aeromicrobium wangtongii]|uniref:DUF3237 domain-containing protein n=1 Tax=Aeromicrobium wangtongii TaxID=2969247 RepID=UPI0020174706|nr:DUF3237 domain-containing protein [Aeromicrobium wangtongii]MCL3819853.1 DUF3237 domain-containing protein [Aeromicrobium wangtongii]
MKLTPFATYTAPLDKLEMRGDGPRGHRLIGPIIGATIEGDQLQATQRGASSADWLLMGPDGTVVVDVRMSIRTHDGAFIQMTYGGRARWADGIGSGDVYSAFTFDTDDPRYSWLTRRLVVGRGVVHPTHGVYSLHLLD